MEYLRVKNWKRFQHYRDRCPPWIKLHYEILTSRDWVMLDERNRLLALVCMLIASRHDGTVPNDPTFIQRVAYLKQRPNLKPLIEIGFLEYASGCKRVLADDTTETETETEEETETERARAGRKTVDFEVWWNNYPKKTGKGAARKAWDRIKDRPPLDAMLSAVQQQMKSDQWTRDGGQYIPNPSTWLNQERWNDEPMAAPKVGDDHQREWPYSKADYQDYLGGRISPDDWDAYMDAHEHLGWTPHSWPSFKEWKSVSKADATA